MLFQLNRPETKKRSHYWGLLTYHALVNILTVFLSERSSIIYSQQSFMIITCQVVALVIKKDELYSFVKKKK